MQIISLLFHALYWLVGVTIVARAVLLMIAYTKTPTKRGAGVIPSFLLSVAAEVALFIAITFSFPLSQTGLICITFLCFTLYLTRHLAPFEKVATQHIYSLMMMWFPKKRKAMNKALTFHLF